ncbi:phosphotransferase family protein [Streptomyces sp. NPDC015131]|uniref:phosphotransferase family protein n=1 Tax=Streptomyces sp. NPDC015131 TaxID=3364941 RepID=UPI0036FA5968
MQQQTEPLLAALDAVAVGAAHLFAPGGACRACGAGVAGTGGGVLADRPDGTVVRHGVAVAKAHAPDTETAPHRVRLAVAAHPELAGILLPPLPLPAAPPALAGRPVSVWPHGSPVDPDAPDAAPWEDAAALLARLHRVPPAGLPAPLPPMRGPAKAARAVTRLRAAAGRHPAARPVLAAWAGLPAWARGEGPDPGAALCHGDFHLGQLVRHPAGTGPWLLIDVDDLGTGDPAWDLARPAAWYAAGLLAPEAWERFLGAYRAAGGTAVPAEGDPWPRLDVPARALTVQTAALAVAKSAAARRELDDSERRVVDACARIATLPGQLGVPDPS